MEKKTLFYINGKWVAPATPNDFDVINPANETAYATISLGSKADVEDAVEAAAAAKRAVDGSEVGSRADDQQVAGIHDEPIHQDAQLRDEARPAAAAGVRI